RMKTTCLPRCLVFVASLLLAIAPTVRAQTSATGAIEGRVQNLVSGDNLNNARVSVKGTSLVAFTDEDGTFHLTGVPAGPATLRVFFTGLDEKEMPVNVTAGGTAVQDIKLTSKARYGDASETVKLDQFVVQSTKETNADAIAINEQ